MHPKASSNELPGLAVTGLIQDLLHPPRGSAAKSAALSSVFPRSSGEEKQWCRVTVVAGSFRGQG